MKRILLETPTLTYYNKMTEKKDEKDNRKRALLSPNARTDEQINNNNKKIFTNLLTGQQKQRTKTANINIYGKKYPNKATQL